MPDEAFSAFREYKDSPHLDMCGIHLHVGSQNPDPAVYTEAFEKLFDGLLRIYRETGIQLRHINLGGGFPVNYSRGKLRLPEEFQQRYDEMVEKGYSETTRPDGAVVRRPVPKQILDSHSRSNMLEAEYEPHDAACSGVDRDQGQRPVSPEQPIYLTG